MLGMPSWHGTVTSCTSGDTSDDTSTSAAIGVDGGNTSGRGVGMHGIGGMGDERYATLTPIKRHTLCMG